MVKTNNQSNPDVRKPQHSAAVPLTNKIGLHARPAIQLTKLAKRFECRIQIRTARDAAWIDAKSIVQVMAAKAPEGTVLEIMTTGPDAGEALQALVELIENKFGTTESTKDVEVSDETGHIASKGLAIGKAVHIEKDDFGERPAGSIESETQLLLRAIEATKHHLKTLMDNADKDVAEVLEFQLSLVQDPSLVDPAVAAVADGLSSHVAWTRTMNSQVRRFEQMDDPYFKGRTSDLMDLKQHVLRCLYNETEALPTLDQDAIIIADELVPSAFAMIDQRYCMGIVLQKGSLNSHVALLARSRGIPMLIGYSKGTPKPGSMVILDAVEGRLIVAPDQATLTDYQQRIKDRAKQAESRQKYLTVHPTLPTGERVYVSINIGTLEDLESVSADHCDGVGLVRTEFLFSNELGMPDEELQFLIYRKIMEWAGDKPVIVRTLDAGGDKPVEGLTEKNECNPFLGVRGIRLSLLNEDIFRVQLRALVRASAFGNLKIMLPMVTVPQELERARVILNEIVDQLRSVNPAVNAPPLGIMVEVPAVAICIEDFNADFYSIGSNDLIQYITACDRSERRIAHLYTGANRAVFELIKTTIDYGRKTAKQISLCGDMASQSDYIDSLLDIGLRYFSVSPGDLTSVKATIENRKVKKVDPS